MEKTNKTKNNNKQRVLIIWSYMQLQLGLVYSLYKVVMKIILGGHKRSLSINWQQCTRLLFWTNKIKDDFAY